MFWCGIRQQIVLFDKNCIYYDSWVICRGMWVTDVKWCLYVLRIFGFLILLSIFFYIPFFSYLIDVRHIQNVFKYPKVIRKFLHLWAAIQVIQQCTMSSNLQCRTIWKNISFLLNYRKDYSKCTYYKIWYFFGSNNENDLLDKFNAF